MEKRFERITMREAFKRFANLDLEKLQDYRELRKVAEKLSLIDEKTKESWQDTFNRIFLTLIETSLPKDHPIVLMDYPRQIECLAKDEGNYKRRWELYVEGVEIANCYWEETNPNKIKSYYEKERALIYNQRASNERVIPDFDDKFYLNFGEKYPESSGVAIGLDRLLMLECRKLSLEGVILFPFSDMIC
ncbi:MAG: amino acid--tRNA ligase-related protein [Sphaerochaetaceae bacterium]